jgi:hypothetical protein
MAPANDASKVTDKGKGKATDSKADEVKKGKDGQSQAISKKEDDKIDGWLPFFPGAVIPAWLIRYCYRRTKRRGSAAQERA